MDQNKYINAYVDSAVGIIHENLSSILQLKAQIRVVNDTMLEKDQVIATLQSQLDQVKNNDASVAAANEKAAHWEASYHTMSNKIAHMDTLLNQVKEMKALIQERDSVIVDLKNKLEEIKNPKKVTTSKTKKLVTEPPIVDQPVVKNLSDDF
jgi:chromosome segregation ATPase